MPGICLTDLNDGDADLRGRLIAIYAVLIGGEYLSSGSGRWSHSGDPGAVGHGVARLYVRSAARGRRRPHRGDRQRDPQADAARQRPVAVGFFFSLGHSLVVCSRRIAVVAAPSHAQRRFDDLKAFGGIIGTLVSAFFLFAAGRINIVIVWFRSTEPSRR